MSDQQIEKIDDLRASLTAQVDELRRRAEHVREVLSPATYWRLPWVRAGVGAGAVVLAALLAWRVVARIRA